MPPRSSPGRSTERRSSPPPPSSARGWRPTTPTQTEQLVGFHKTGSGRPSITWPQSVREALCFGWIDGVRRSIDEHSYAIRFTPRKPRRTWSAINIAARRRADRVRRDAPGRARRVRRADRGQLRHLLLRAGRRCRSAPSSPRGLRADAKAAAFFDAQPPSYRRTATHWVMSAKRAETRERRLATLIADSRDGLQDRAVAPVVESTDDRERRRRPVRRRARARVPRDQGRARHARGAARRSCC